MSFIISRQLIQTFSKVFAITEKAVLGWVKNLIFSWFINRKNFKKVLQGDEYQNFLLNKKFFYTVFLFFFTNFIFTKKISSFFKKYNIISTHQIPLRLYLVKVNASAVSLRWLHNNIPDSYRTNRSCKNSDDKSNAVVCRDAGWRKNKTLLLLKHLSS